MPCRITPYQKEQWRREEQERKQADILAKEVDQQRRNMLESYSYWQTYQLRQALLLRD